MKRISKRQIILMAVGLCLLFIWPRPEFLTAQQVDPFYKQLYDKAVNAYRVGDYKEAARDFEVGLFGLLSSREYSAKCNVYLSLCSFFRKDRQKCREYLDAAQKHLDEEGFLGLELDAQDLFNLESVWYLFYPRTSIFPGRNEPLEKPRTNHVSTGNSEEAIEALEGRISTQPKAIYAYYELYDLYVHEDNNRRAKKTLEKLIKNNSREIKGYYLLGKMEYRERDFRGAGKHLERFLNLSKDVPVENTIMTESLALLILNYNSRGNKKKAQELALDYLNQLTETALQAVSLTDAEMAALRDIIKLVRRLSD